MKKIFVYAAVAALAMTAISCQKESLNENEKVSTSNDGLVFTASIDAGMDTRTTLTSEKKVNWEANDEITVNGVIYTAAPKSDATKADFTKKNSGDADPTGTFNAFYPTGIQTGITAGGTLPAEQTYAAGKITNVPMFATSTTTSLSFKNICAVLAVTVKNADFPSVKSIKVSSSNCALSGAFTISDGQTATLTEATTVANTVTLNCGATAVTAASEGTVFYIAIPAQTYQNLKIELSSDGSSYTKSMTTKKDADIAVAVNTVYPITFKEDAPDSIEIDCTNAANFRYDNGGTETAFPTSGHGSNFVEDVDFWLRGLNQYVFHGSVKNWGNTLNAANKSKVKLPAIEGYVLTELEVTYSNASASRDYQVYDGTDTSLGKCSRGKTSSGTTKITVASSSNADRYFVCTNGEMCARFILTYTKN